jgi:hypothetical protein
MTIVNCYGSWEKNFICYRDRSANHYDAITALRQAVASRICWDGSRPELGVEVQLPYEPCVVRLPFCAWRLELDFEVSEECGHKLVDLEQAERRY